MEGLSLHSGGLWSAVPSLELVLLLAFKILSSTWDLHDFVVMLTLLCAGREIGLVKHVLLGGGGGGVSHNFSICFVQQDMIHIADTKVARRYGDFFIRQIHKFEEVNIFCLASAGFCLLNVWRRPSAWD